jgi:hypothetical protein
MQSHRITINLNPLIDRQDQMEKPVLLVVRAKGRGLSLKVRKFVTARRGCLVDIAALQQQTNQVKRILVNEIILTLRADVGIMNRKMKVTLVGHVTGVRGLETLMNGSLRKIQSKILV